MSIRATPSPRRRSLVLAAALVASVTANGVLWMRGQESAEAAATAAGPSAGCASRSFRERARPAPVGPDSTPDSLAGLRDRLEAVEQEIRLARARLAGLGELSPLDFAVGQPGGLREKLKAIAALDRDTRIDAFQRLLLQVGEGAPESDEILWLIADENDLDVLRMLPELMESCGVFLADTDLPEFLGLLRDGEPPERRIAVASVIAEMRLYQQRPDWREGVIRTLREERDPRVVAALCTKFEHQPGLPAPEQIDALRAAADRLPAGDRRPPLRALAVALLPEDGGSEIYRRWERAGLPEMRQDLADALAHAGLFRPAGEPASPDAFPAGERESRFIAVYHDADSLETRTRMLLSGMRGLGVIAGSAEQAAACLRRIARAEPDAEQARRIDRAADRVAEGEALEAEETQQLLLGLWIDRRGTPK